MRILFINNDGGGKQSFTAPGVAGQEEVVALAHAVAGVVNGSG